MKWKRSKKQDHFMAHRTILTERQRSALFDLPTDDASMMRHYILADDDIEHINERRRPTRLPEPTKTNMKTRPADSRYE